MISFHSPYQLTDREAINYLKTHQPEEKQRWLTFNAKKLTLSLDVFKAYFQDGLISMLKEDEPPEPRENVIFLDLSIPSKLTIDLFKGELDLFPEVSQRDAFKYSRSLHRNH